MKTIAQLTLLATTAVMLSGCCDVPVVPGI